MSDAKKKPLDPAKHDQVLRQLRHEVNLRQQGYRERALKILPHICGSCAREFSGKRLRELTVHHKDHNWQNNPPDGSNWELLCIYCHDFEHEKSLSMNDFSRGSGAGPAAAAPSGFTPFAALDALVLPPVAAGDDAPDAGAAASPPGNDPATGATTVPEGVMPWQVNAPLVEVHKEVYRACEAEGRAPVVSVRYLGPGLERLEVHAAEVRDDVPEARQYRVSPDNGRTWSAFTPLPAIPRLCQGVEVLEHEFPDVPYDPLSGVHLGFLLRQIQANGVWNNFTYARISRDGGRTWTHEQPLTYEPGALFEPGNPLNPQFLLRNQGYPGTSLLLHSNGTRILFLAHANAPDDPKNDARMWKNGSVCMIARWDAAAATYNWQPGARIAISPQQSGRGLMEPDAAELADGRILVVWRGSNDAWDGSKEVTEPGRKWYSISADGGRTLAPLAAWRYDDGSPFYSPSSIHRFLRHSLTRKLYWLGNICATPPSGNSPRYPLVLAEVDERTGCLKKNRVTAIDDRRPDQGEGIQFSNFSFFEDRESHRLEIYLTAYGERPGADWRTANCYRYRLTL